MPTPCMWPISSGSIHPMRMPVAYSEPVCGTSLSCCHVSSYTPRPGTGNVLLNRNRICCNKVSTTSMANAMETIHRVTTTHAHCCCHRRRHHLLRLCYHHHHHPPTIVSHNGLHGKFIPFETGDGCGVFMRLRQIINNNNRKVRWINHRDTVHPPRRRVFYYGNNKKPNWHYTNSRMNRNINF